MSDITVYNQYDIRFTSLFDDGEVNEGDDMCDPIGYEPFEQQVLDLLNAGETLSAWFEENYPNDYVDPEDSSDSTSSTLSELRYMDEMELRDQLSNVTIRLQQQAAAAASQAQSTQSTSTSPPVDSSDTGSSPISQ